ncbi:MAG: helix-hairpin-helix domain-containing protein [Almyronema sp.]
MVKVVSRKSLGIQPVFDIGVAKDHNFLLANGQVASNCFNKSHSMAYGFVTYQTAYLKANYPVEYMAALLTANSGDQDKVQMHIANCISMGIEVLPPNVNRSGIDFTPEHRSILFGLSAVRNVGQGAIECILETRAEDGVFQSLADLCDRVDLRTVNRRALEALIQCGAFDLMEPNRNQLMHDLDFVLEWAQGRAKDRAIGQGSLFDMLGSSHSNDVSTPSGGFELAPKAPTVADFDPQEKLRLEKELLGFYISDHPLKSVQRSARVLAPISLSELPDQPEKVTISAIVMLSSVKPVVTKKGDRMAIVQVEDLTGQAEGVVFPRAFERIGRYIEADARLMIWGKVDRRDDRNQLIIEDAEPIETVRLVMVELEPQIAADITYQHRLRTILQQQGDEQEAKVPVVAIIGANQQRQFVRLGAQFRVKDPDAAVAALTKADFKARSTPLITA